MSATDCDEDSSVSSYSSGSDVIVDEYKWVRRQIRPLKKGVIFARRYLFRVELSVIQEICKLGLECMGSVTTLGPMHDLQRT